MSTSTGNLQSYEAKNRKRISDLSQIVDLPSNQHTVMSLVSSREMSYSRLCDAVKHLSDDKRLSQSQLDSTLYELISIGYLSSFMEDGEIIYMVQLKGKQDKRDEQRLWKGMDIPDIAQLREQMKKKKGD